MAPHYLSLIDIHTSGPRYDVTPLFADPAAFAALVQDLLAGLAGVAFDYVAGIDALGFILGTALAWQAGKGFVPIRKGGKLPVAADEVAFVDYTRQRKTLELRRGALPPGARVVVVDEWVETGAQMAAAIELIEQQGGVVAGLATINMDDNPLTQTLRQRYRCSVIGSPEGA